MRDLISRQAAIDALHMHLMYRMGTDSNKKRLDDWINGLPSAQPEIIRCKDCRFAILTYDGDCKYCQYLEGEFGLTDAVYFDGNDYCSHAERRTNEPEK